MQTKLRVDALNSVSSNLADGKFNYKKGHANYEEGEK